MSMTEETRQQFEQEEQAYWNQRDVLLKQYLGKWIAIVDGKVVAVADQMQKVMADAFHKTKRKVMYVALVGDEDVEFRVRQVATGWFNTGYHHPIPMVTVLATSIDEAAQTDVDLVVDTGADITILRNSIADQLDLWSTPTARARIIGLGGVSQVRQLYGVFVQVAGQAVIAAVDCRDDIGEDILGRDVLNEFELTVCAKRDVVRLVWVPYG